MPVLVDFNSRTINGMLKKDRSDLISRVGPTKALFMMEDKSAFETCAFGFCDSNNTEPLAMVGRTYGQIVEPKNWEKLKEPPKWEDIFHWDGHNVPVSQMTELDFFKSYQRFKAVQKLRHYFVLDYGKKWGIVKNNYSFPLDKQQV